MSREPISVGGKLSVKTLLHEACTLANAADVYYQLILCESDSSIHTIPGPLASICKIQVGTLLIKYFKIRGNLDVQIEVYKSADDEAEGVTLFTTNDLLAALDFLKKHLCVRMVEAFIRRLRTQCMSDPNGILLTTTTSASSTKEGMTYKAHVNFLAYPVAIGLDISVTQLSDIRIYITGPSIEDTLSFNSIAKAESYVFSLLKITKTN